MDRGRSVSESRASGARARASVYTIQKLAQLQYNAIKPPPAPKVSGLLL